MVRQRVRMCGCCGTWRTADVALKLHSWPSEGQVTQPEIGRHEVCTAMDLMTCTL